MGACTLFVGGARPAHSLPAISRMPAGMGGVELMKGGIVAVETETIRNVCLIGHRGSGKTSIAEGMIGLAGRSGPTSGVLDYTDEERPSGA